MKNKIIYFLILLISYSSFGQSTTEEYKLIRKMNLNKAYKFDFDKPFGVKSSFSGTNKKITVSVNINRPIEYYSSCTNTKVKIEDLKLFEFFTETSNSNSYIHDGGFNRVYFQRELNNSFGIAYNDCDNSKNSSGQMFLRKQVYFADKKLHLKDPSGWRIFGDEYANVEISLKLEGGITIEDINSIKIPGISEIKGTEFFDPAQLLEDRIANYLQAGADAPNKTFVIAHRGYYQGQGVPENGLKATKNAIAYKVPMVEIDVQHTTAYSSMTTDAQSYLLSQWGVSDWSNAPSIANDTVYFTSHDYEIGNPLRTYLPDRLKNHPKIKLKNNIKTLYFRYLTLCDVRPDLCPQFTGCDCDPFANDGTGCNEYIPEGYNGSFSRPCEPVQLSQVGGEEYENSSLREPIATLQELLNLAKTHGVLVNLDKLDDDCRHRTDGTSKTDHCDALLQPYHRVYKEIKDAGMENYTVVKGKSYGNPNLENPTDFINTFNKYNGTPYEIDWSKFMFTPTFFSEYTINQNVINSWFDHPTFNCVGIELIYANENDPLYSWVDDIRAKGGNVISFPAYPEACDYYLDHPKVFHHYNWNWLLENEIHRPSVIISDRLEMLSEVVELMNLNYE